MMLIGYSNYMIPGVLVMSIISIHAPRHVHVLVGLFATCLGTRSPPSPLQSTLGPYGAICHLLP